MNYSYGGYSPYSMYGGYQQPQPQQMQNQYQAMQQPQMQNMNQNQEQNYQRYLPLTFVNGLVGAKSFIVGPNQIYYLKDSDKGSNLLFEKKSNAQGEPSLRAWELKEINIEDIGKPKEEKIVQPTIDTSNFVKRNELVGFATQEDINKLEVLFDTKIDKLLSKIEKLSKTQILPLKSENKVE